MRRAILILLILALVGFAKAEITFTDSTGSEITLAEYPKNVCVLFSSFADMWKIAGGEISITVHESVERGFAPQNAVLVDSGAGKNIDMETLVYNWPDFVIGSADVPAHVEAKRFLEKAGIPTALFRVESIKDYIGVMETLTDITGNKDAYLQYAENVYERSREIIHRAEMVTSDRPNVLFIRSGSGYSSAKAKTREQHFAAAMLSELGAKNIAENIPVILDGLSFENILAEDPDIIFISLMGNEEKSKAYMESVLASQNWQSLSAVRSERVYFLEKDLFQFKPNAKWDVAYRKLFDMLYPETEVYEEE